jgi:hypothetical protein
MKEVLTKSFWQGVKKTFHDALEDPTPSENVSQTPADPSVSPIPEPSSPSVPTERN